MHTESAQPRSGHEQKAISLLQQNNYEEVQKLLERETGERWSKGRIYRLALHAGARKTEARIRERAEERRRRQEETLRELIGSTAKADVLDFLDGIPDNSVQLVLTSPPYNVGKKYGDTASADTMRAVYYHGWLMQVLSETSRILKDGGILFLQIGPTRDETDRLIPLDILLFDDIRRSGLAFQSRVVWTIPHGLTPKRRLAERYETALVFSKGETAHFNPTAARTPQKNPGKRYFKGPNSGQLSCHPLGAWPTNVWNDIPTVRHNHPERRFGEHPAQFPIALAKRAILLYTMPDELVCDPFCGSGTTHIACIETGRAFVGADLFYENIRIKRIANAHSDGISPLPGISEETAAVWQAEARRISVEASPTTPEEEEQLVITFCATQ